MRRKKRVEKRNVGGDGRRLVKTTAQGRWGSSVYVKEKKKEKKEKTTA